MWRAGGLGGLGNALAVPDSRVQPTAARVVVGFVVRVALKVGAGAVSINKATRLGVCRRRHRHRVVRSM